MPGYRAYIAPWEARILERLAKEKGIDVEDLIAFAAEVAAQLESTIAKREARNKSNANT